ncbi:MAG: sigma factor-like helix-turn-helix DNA-binding protein [Candidatus Diapherotrites archaeon]
MDRIAQEFNFLAANYLRYHFKRYPEVSYSFEQAYSSICYYFFPGFLSAVKEHGIKNAAGGLYKLLQKGSKKVIFREVRRSQGKNIVPLDLQSSAIATRTPHMSNPGRFEEMIAHLSNREKRILRYRYEQGLTFEETGKKLSLHHTRIQQIEEKTLQKMRRWLERERHPNNPTQSRE